MWVKLLTVKQIELAGSTKTYYPGDWVDIGKHLAMRWVAEGDAVVMDYNLIANLAGVGVTLPAGVKATALQAVYNDIEVRPEERENPLPFARTVIISEGITLRPGLLPVGIGLLSVKEEVDKVIKELDRWQIAVPFIGYSSKDLAVYRGSESDRNITKQQILDLRVPVYDTRLMFVRRCPDTRRLLEVWGDWRKQVKDANLAFLCALWDVKPLICALPTRWRGKG